jgi:hypothetical protein
MTAVEDDEPGVGGPSRGSNHLNAGHLPLCLHLALAFIAAQLETGFQS